MHDCRVISGEGAWAIGGAVAKLQQVDLGKPSEPAFEHRSFTIHKPVFQQGIPRGFAGKVGRVHWDGGAKQKLGIGYGGYLGWTPSGEWVGG